jgi:opacity protein-like surface antigen
VAIGNSTASDVTGSVTVSQYAIQGAFIGALPLGGSGFDLTGRLGLGYNHAGITGTGAYVGNYGSTFNSSFIYGFGGKYNFNDSLALNLKYDYLGKFMAQTGATGVDISRVSLGLQYSY